MSFSENECRALARATKNMAKMGHKTAATKAGYRNLAIMYTTRADDLKRHREVKSDFDHWQKVHKKTRRRGNSDGKEK
jgi:hypothetical protein